MLKQWKLGLSRLGTLLLSAAVAVSVAGCQSAPTSSVEVSSSEAVQSEVPSSETMSSQEPKTQIRVAALKGPTGMGLLELMDKNEQKLAENDYTITLAGSPDELVSKITTGEVDAAAVPTNLAAVLYHKLQGGVQLAALNTLGVLSVVTKGTEINSIADLKGKTVYSSGQGSVPEYALNYILKQNGLEAGKDVTVEYQSEHAALASLLLSGQAQIAVLPEPFVTQVMKKDPEVKLALDLTAEWDKAAQGKSVLTMGCLIVRTEFAEQNKAAFDAFLREYNDSVTYVNNETENAAALSEKYGIMPAAVAKQAIPNCNIVFISGAEMKEKMPAFFEVLMEADPKSIGGKLPDDAFYYAD